MLAISVFPEAGRFRNGLEKVLHNSARVGDRERNMKTIMRLLLIALVVSLVSSARAVPYTNYLDQASNAVATAYAQLNELPPPLSPELAKARTALGKALKALERPSRSLVTDYNIFMFMAIQLTPHQATLTAPELGLAMTNAYLQFLLEAGTQVAVLSNRLSMVTEFQPLRRVAGGQVARAYNALVFATQSTDVFAGILSVRTALTRLATAAKLTAKAEAKPGTAVESLAGLTLVHQERGSSGEVVFLDGMNHLDINDDDQVAEPGTYTYQRTGLKTGTLVLTEMSESSDEVITVNLRFKTSTSGSFSFRAEESGRTERGSGKFTLEVSE